MTDEVRQEQEPEQAKGAMDQDLVLPEDEQEGIKGGTSMPIITVSLPPGGGG